MADRPGKIPLFPSEAERDAWRDKQIAEARRIEALPRRCPDDGTCHHECAATDCFRVRYCGPLTGVFPNDEWPAGVIHDVDPSDPNTMGCTCTCDGCRSGNCHAKGRLMSHISQQMPDGSWRPAQPIDWQEEHGWLARLIFWLRRIEHCNDREGQRRRRFR